MPKATFITFLIVISILTFLSQASAVTYECNPVKRVDPNKEWSKEEINKWEFSNKLEDFGDTAYIARCSFSSRANKVTCDR